MFCLLKIAGSYPEGSQAASQLPLPLSRWVAPGCWVWRWSNPCLQPPKWRIHNHFQWAQGCSYSPAVRPPRWQAGVWLEGEALTSGARPFHRDPWGRLTCPEMFSIWSVASAHSQRMVVRGAGAAAGAAGRSGALVELFKWRILWDQEQQKCLRLRWWYI